MWVAGRLTEILADEVEGYATNCLDDRVEGHASAWITAKCLYDGKAI